MKAVRNYGLEGIRVEDIPRPTPTEGEALIRILYSGICGSDLHIYKKGMFITYTPETMGHEFVGEIVETGGGEFEVGQLVVGDPRVPCLECTACAEHAHQRCVALGFIGEVSQGCFTEYLAMPWDKLIKLDRIEKIEYGALVEPLAVAYHICNEAGFGPDDNVVVFGCGPIGLLTIALAKKIFGARTVTAVGIATARHEKAGQPGAGSPATPLDEGPFKEYDKPVAPSAIAVHCHAPQE